MKYVFSIQIVWHNNEKGIMRIQHNYYREHENHRMCTIRENTIVLSFDLTKKNLQNIHSSQLTIGLHK